MYERHKTKNLNHLAAGNRKNSTDVERKIWSLLRNNKMGCKFRRQQQIGDYIADFVCMESGLIIECDGGQHCESEEDKIRTKSLEEKGYKIIRFWNTDILKNIEGVYSIIEKEIQKIPLTPALSRKGRGG